MKRVCVLLMIVLMVVMLPVTHAAAETTNTVTLSGNCFYPEDFDENTQYPVALLFCDSANDETFWDAFYAPMLTGEGIICLSAGAGDTPEAVLSYAKTLPYVNQNAVFAIGAGSGSVEAQLLAAKYSDEIAGVVAMYGGLTMEQAEVDLGQLPEKLYEQGEVLIIWGADDDTYSFDQALANTSMYEQAVLTVIGDAGHGFGAQEDRAAMICARQAADFIDRTVNGIPNEKKKTSKASNDDLKASEEGYTYHGDGYDWSVRYAVKDDVAIFGRMYYPTGFDASKHYPIVIMAHGNMGTADVWDKVAAPRVAQAGECLVYAFDARSETDSGRGSYSTPLEGVEINKNTVDDYANDLDQVIDFVRSLDYVDSDGVYLMGGSKGGMTVQLAASRRPADIRGIIVQSGAIGDDTAGIVKAYDAMKAAPYNGGEALFVQGVEDQSCIISRGEENRAWYQQSTLVAISGAGHGFAFQNDRATEIFVDSMNDFIHRTYNKLGE